MLPDLEFHQELIETLITAMGDSMYSGQGSLIGMTQRAIRINIDWYNKHL